MSKRRPKGSKLMAKRRQAQAEWVARGRPKPTPVYLDRARGYTGGVIMGEGQSRKEGSHRSQS